MRIVTRCLVAAAGMMACAYAALAPFALPPLMEWMSVEREGLEGLAQLVVELARHAVPAGAAVVLLAVVARVERTRVTAYLGDVTRGRSIRAFIMATLAAAAVSAAAMGVVHVAGWDAGRADAGVSSHPVVILVVFGLARAFLLQAIQEELWFRGFAFRGYLDRPWLVLGATTAVFTVLHLTSSGGQESTAERFLYLVLPLGMGFLAGVVRWTSGAVSGAVGVHGGVHTGLLLPALLGWSMGPAGWVCVGTALVAAGVVHLLVRRPWRVRRESVRPVPGALAGAAR